MSDATHASVRWSCASSIRFCGSIEDWFVNSNINVFGFTFIITFACVVTSLDISLLKFLIYLGRLRRTKVLGPRIDRWIQDGVLQLQRRAYEARGQGTWTGLDQDVPTTLEEEKLPDLLRENDNPGMRKPSALTSGVIVETKPGENDQEESRSVSTTMTTPMNHPPLTTEQDISKT